MVDQATDLDVLAVASISGDGIRPLFSAGTYQVLAAPRFAPNGQQIAFSGVTDIPKQQGRAPTRPDVLAWLRPGVAAAHGIPWDIWLINVDGSGRERLTDLQEDSPMAAWSPDGTHLAIKGELGLYMLELPSKKIVRMALELAGDGLDWLMP
jgi:Tol biopolymer transport system component